MALFTAIGTALGASSAAAFGTGVLASVVGGSAIAGATANWSGGGSTTNMPDLPQSPTTSGASINARAEAQRRRQAMSRSESVYTSPLGLAGEASVARNTLLGR